MRLTALLPPVRRVADETPPDRDRVLDAVRGISLFVVVFGHLIMAVVYWPQAGGARIGNLMAAYPALQYFTWILQVMPVFFAFGGAASVIAWRRADQRGVLYSTWMWGRIRRLLRPVLVYLAVMAVLSAVLSAIVGPAVEPLLGIINTPLWFLGIYTLTLLFLPAMWWLHQRNRAIAFVVLVPLAVIDSVGVTVLGWPVWVGFLNFLFCWLAIQQLGFFWGEPTSQRTWAIVAVISLAINVVLVRFGPWPVSLVGLPGDVLDYDSLTLFGVTVAVPGFHGEYSNMSPPSLVLMLHGFTLVALIFLLRKQIQALLARPRVWLATTFMTMTAMTLYIWHLFAIVLSLATLHALGHPPPTRIGPSGFPEPVSTGEYAAWFALFLLMFVVYLSVLVLALWSTSYRPLPLWDTPARRGILPLSAPGWLYVLGVVASGVLIGFGVLVVALIGFAGFPLENREWGGLTLNAVAGLILLVGGSLLLRALARQPSPSGRGTRRTVASSR